MLTSPWCPRQHVTSPWAHIPLHRLPRNFLGRGSFGEVGVMDGEVGVKGRSRTCRGRHREVGIVEFGLKRTSKGLTDMSACHLHLLCTVDVGEKSEAESVTAWWISEAVNGQWRHRCMKWFTNTTVQFIVRNAAPVRRLHVLHWLHGRRNCRWWHCPHTQQEM